MADETTNQKTPFRREFDPSRWSHAIFAVGGFLAAWMLTNFIEDVWAVLWSYYPTLGRPVPFMANAMGVSLALVATVWAWRRKPWFQFVTEMVNEVSQVTWPSRAETRAATIVVIIMTLVASAILAAMDTVWSAFTDWLYGV